MTARPFVLARHEDPSGISGIGLVCEGVEWTGGGVTLHWLTETESTADFPGGLAAVLAVHGHNGATVVRYLDEPEQHCGNGAPGIRHEVAVAELDGESGYTVCLWPCGHEVPNSPTQCDCVPPDTSGAPY